MLKSYIKKIVKSELAKEKLNKSYGKYKPLVMYFNDTIHRQNNELSKLYNTNSYLKETIENLEGKLILKGNLLSGLKQEYGKLKQENEKLEESIKNLGGTLSLKDNLLNEKNKEIEELKALYEQEKLEKNKFLFNTYGEKYEIDSLKLENEELKEENKHLKNTLKLSKNTILELKDSYEQEKNKNYKTLESEELKKEIEKLKKENEQLKNLSCTIVVDNDGKLDSLFNQKLKSENEKLIGDKEILKDALSESNNYVTYLEKENKKLNEKLNGIKYVIKKQRLSALTYEKLKDTFMLIERYIKES